MQTRWGSPGGDPRWSKAEEGKVRSCPQNKERNKTRDRARAAPFGGRSDEDPENEGQRSPCGAKPREKKRKVGYSQEVAAHATLPFAGPSGDKEKRTEKNRKNIEKKKRKENKEEPQRKSKKKTMQRLKKAERKQWKNRIKETGALKMQEEHRETQKDIETHAKRYKSIQKKQNCRKSIQTLLKQHIEIYTFCQQDIQKLLNIHKMNWKHIHKHVEKSSKTIYKIIEKI